MKSTFPTSILATCHSLTSHLFTWVSLSVSGWRQTTLASLLNTKSLLNKMKHWCWQCIVVTRRLNFSWRIPEGNYIPLLWFRISRLILRQWPSMRCACRETCSLYSPMQLPWFPARRFQGNGPLIGLFLADEVKMSLTKRQNVYNLDLSVVFS